MQVNKGKLYTDKQYIELLKIRIKELEEENKSLKTHIKTIKRRRKKQTSKKNKYKKRIDKAIEFIEKNKQLSMFADLRKEGTHQYDLECDADELLDILKGE